MRIGYSVERRPNKCVEAGTVYMWREQTKAYICNVCEFLETNYCMTTRWLTGPLQKSFPPWRKALVTPLTVGGGTSPCRGPVRNTLLSCVKQPLFVSPRLVSIRMRTRAGYITVISAYAPTLLGSDEDKDEFYQQLSDLLSSNPAGHDIALLGDFNARIGVDTDSWTSVIGRLV